MNTWLLISIGAAVVIFFVAALTFRARGHETGRASASDSLPALGGTLVVLGIIFGATDRFLGYALIGAGVALSLVLAAVRLRRRPPAPR